MTAYVTFRLLAALLLGTVWYALDRRFGLRLNRWWYDLTHEHPMQGEPTQGIIHGRGARTRFFASVLVASLLTILAFAGGEFYPLLEMAIWLFSVPAAFFGFMLGPRIYGLWQRRDVAFEAVDKWERGELDLSDELRNRTAELSGKLKRTVTSEPVPARPISGSTAVQRPADEAAPSAHRETPEDSGREGDQSLTSPAAPAAPAAPTEEEVDPQELVNRYLKRGN